MTSRWIHEIEHVIGGITGRTCQIEGVYYVET